MASLIFAPTLEFMRDRNRRLIESNRRRTKSNRWQTGSNYRTGEISYIPGYWDEVEIPLSGIGESMASDGYARMSRKPRGENHPLGEQIGTWKDSDLRQMPDFLLILGTSLQIPGIRRMVKEFAEVVRRGHSVTPRVVLVNRTAPPAACAEFLHVWVKMDCDTWTEQVG